MITMEKVFGMLFLCFMLFNYIWVIEIIIKSIIRRNGEHFIIGVLVLMLMTVCIFK